MVSNETPKMQMNVFCCQRKWDHMVLWLSNVQVPADTNGTNTLIKNFNPLFYKYILFIYFYK